MQRIYLVRIWQRVCRFLHVYPVWVCPCRLLETADSLQKRRDICRCGSRATLSALKNSKRPTKPQGHIHSHGIWKNTYFPGISRMYPATPVYSGMYRRDAFASWNMVLLQHMVWGKGNVRRISATLAVAETRNCPSRRIHRHILERMHGPHTLGYQCLQIEMQGVRPKRVYVPCPLKPHVSKNTFYHKECVMTRGSVSLYDV